MENQTEYLTALRGQVDEIVTQLMLGDGSETATPAMLATLSRIAEEAERQGLTRVAGECQLLKDETSADALLTGLSRLQAAVDASSVSREIPVGETSSAQSADAPTAAETEDSSAAFSLADDPELVGDFLVESADHLSNVEQQLLLLEQDPASSAAMQSAFRSFHTIKGLAGFLELHAVRDIAHETETLLDLARTGKLVVSAPVIDVLLEGADSLTIEIERIRCKTRGEKPGPPCDIKKFLSRVTAVMNPSEAPAPPKPAPQPTVTAVQAPPAVAPAVSDVVSEAVLEAKSSAPVEAPVSTPALPEEAAPQSGDTKRSSSTAEARLVKVDTRKLDFLVDMVGELVIAQSLVRHDGHLQTVSNPKLQRNISQLSRITAEVQKTAMSMRMVQVGQLFQRSTRLVRDLSRKAGKRADLEIQGEDTELDRTIVEELADPLMHMIRNSVDHGIEGPEEREASGKPTTAKISLKAYHQSGTIVIEVGDDGRGLNREKILKKARERGLVQDGSNLSDGEVYQLIFEAGFSTAEKLTEISGRGVGMDVVRRNIQKMRGRIEIQSELGVGTTFFLRLPLTLAIIDGLVVKVGKERFIVPIYVVHEIFRPHADTVFTVEGRREMILVREHLLPVVRLHRCFGVEPVAQNLADSVVVVAESGGRKFCLTVDELIGKQEVVIKSLGDTFKNVQGIAGGAILGDGLVGLILDVDGLTGDSCR